MKNALLKLIFAVFVTIGAGQNSSAQGPQYSEYILKYNLATHQIEDGKKIPFDHPFTLIVDSLSGRNTIAVQIFESRMDKGIRTKVYHHIKDCDNTIVDKAVKDKDLEFKKDDGKLIIYVDALKPNVLFDIYVITKMVDKSKALLLKTNLLLALNKTTEASGSFKDFKESMLISNQSIPTTYMGRSYNDYVNFYNSNLNPLYTSVSGHTYLDKSFLTEAELVAIGMSAIKDLPGFKDNYQLLAVIRNKKSIEAQNGLISISEFQKDRDLTEAADWFARIENLKSNLSFFYSLLYELDKLIVSGKNTVIVDKKPIDLIAIRDKVQTIIQDGVIKNLKFLEGEAKKINSKIDEDTNMRSAFFLSGSTVSSDLKTAGGNVLFLDAGITNIFVPGVTGQMVYIPRLYWGASIYFRPIDKNTRRSSFYSKKDLVANRGCINNIVGPDYDVISRRNILQHLCLNIGFTIGGIPNADFDNFYNGTSLLIGPAFRFKRAFKVSAGASMLKRSSLNPLVSEKKPVVGGYVSLSVDIDFIQGLKDITTILFK